MPKDFESLVLSESWPLVFSNFSPEDSHVQPGLEPCLSENHKLQTTFETCMLCIRYTHDNCANAVSQLILYLPLGFGVFFLLFFYYY